MRAAGEARGPDRLEPLVLAEGARVCGDQRWRNSASTRRASWRFASRRKGLGRRLVWFH